MRRCDDDVLPGDEGVVGAEEDVRGEDEDGVKPAVPLPGAALHGGELVGADGDKNDDDNGVDSCDDGP